MESSKSVLILRDIVLTSKKTLASEVLIKESHLCWNLL